MRLGAPLRPLLWALPTPERRGVARLVRPNGPFGGTFDLLTHPPVACAPYLAATAIWHLPVLYDAAQGRTVVHDVEYIAFLGTGLLYWWPLIHPTGGVRRLKLGAGVFYAIPPMLLGNTLGALLTFTNQPLYETYRRAPRVTSLSALEDQQLGGLLMWVPGGLFWLIPLLIVLAAFLKAEERAEQLREARLHSD